MQFMMSAPREATSRATSAACPSLIPGIRMVLILTVMPWRFSSTIAARWRSSSTAAASTPRSTRAAELAAAGLEIAEQLDLVQLVAALLYACGVAALQLGQGDEVRALAARGLELSRAAGDPHYSC